MPDCVALIAASQLITGARCIHTDFDVDADAIRAESPDRIVYALVRGLAPGVASPVAIFGADISNELKRAWLRGPFVTGEGDFATNASLAFDALLAHAGARVDKWDAFTETSHQRALDWYAAQGFKPLKRHSIYIVAREEARFNPVPDAMPPPESMLDAVVELASHALPGGYLTRDDFAAPGDEAITLVLCDGNDLLGYVYASHEHGATEAYVDNLAVAEHARRRGVGRQLLIAALHWAFVARGAPQVGLTVKDGNANAARLYESVGFRLLAEGQHLRRSAAGAA